MYAGTLTHGLVWDDPSLVDSVREMARTGGAGAVLAAEFVLDPMGSESPGYYRPVALVSLWTDSLLAGAFPFTFHLTNILLHAFCSVLVLRLGRLVLPSGRAALSGALLFAVHPAHTESVAFVSGRTDLWLTLFLLLSVCVRIRAQGEGRSPGARPVALSCAWWLLAGLSKEAALAAPAVFLAWDAFGGPGWWRRNRVWLGAWAISLAMLWVLRAGFAGVGFGTGAGPLEGVERWVEEPRRIVVPWILHFKLLAVPWPLRARYDWPVSLSAADVAGCALALGVCLATLRRADGRIGARALVWIAGFLLPVSGALPFLGPAVAERYLYLPSVGFCLAAGALLERAMTRRRARPYAVAAAVAAGAVLAAGTVARARIWESNRTLFRDIARTSPADPTAPNNLGLEQYKAGRFDEAAVSFRHAIALDETFALAHTNLGLCFLAMGRPREAVAAFERAVAMEPDHPGFLSNLGNGYRAAGRAEDAVAAYERALERVPGAARLRMALGLTYADLGRTGEARREVARLRELRSPLAAQLEAELEGRAGPGQGN